jgi:hypothetical protein
VTDSSRDLGARIIQALAAPGANQPAQKPSTGTIGAAAPVPVAFGPSIPYRPTARPPVAMLTMCDDGKDDGAVIRILSHRFVIGRTEGDLRIEIDRRISGRHVEITLQTVAGRHHRWVLTDLESTNGLFVRVSCTRLADQSELLVGKGRYRFDAPRNLEGASTKVFTKEHRRGETHPWHDDTTTTQPPALTELVGNEIGNRVVLLKPEYWIGSDAACPICRPHDPFCEPRHARVYRNARGVWQAENNKTQNGLWMRMSQVAVDSVVHFQIGEQRFRLRVR